MATGIDHIVIAVNDLDTAIANYTEAGFTVTPGGVHTGGLTHNALVAFADGAYFEIIAWIDPANTPANTWFRRLLHGEGLIDFALRSDDLVAEVDVLRAHGLDAPDPAPGGRTRPDGQRVEWMNLRFDEARYPGLPFYCHSTNDRGLRVPSGDAAVHPNGVTGVARIVIGVLDAEKTASEFAILAGSPVTADAEGRPSVAIGSTTVSLQQADTDLATVIADRGQVPIEVGLRSNVQAGALDLALTHGARLVLTPS